MSPFALLLQKMARRDTTVKVKGIVPKNRSLESEDRAHRADADGWEEWSQPHPNVTCFTFPTFPFLPDKSAADSVMWERSSSPRALGLSGRIETLASRPSDWGPSKVT